jgi:prepilin-type N-terminal cleavage/methylation domain-containing protein
MSNRKSTRRRPEKPFPRPFPCPGLSGRSGACGGFTLIEVLLVLILFAIAGAMLVPLLDSGLRGATVAVVRARENSRLVRDMETVTATYQQLRIGGGSGSLDTLRGAMTDLFPDDGGTQWSCSHITFDGTGTETPVPGGGTGDILKVILSRGGVSLTAFFTQ